MIRQCDFAPLTEHTIRNRDELVNELETVRRRGYALVDEEEVIGARTLSVTVSSPETGVVGVVSLSGPASRFEGEYLEELILTLKETANYVEVNLQRK